MATPVRMSAEAKEKLRTVRDPSVVAEILELARTELEAPARGGPLDGVVPDASSVMWWRRAVPFGQLSDFEQFTIDDDDEYGCQAWDYALLYRWMTPDEQIEFRLAEKALLVVDIAENDELIRFLHP